MENIIEYYYNIRIDSIINKGNDYKKKKKKNTLILKEIYKINNISIICNLSNTY